MYACVCMSVELSRMMETATPLPPHRITADVFNSILLRFASLPIFVVVVVAVVVVAVVVIFVRFPLFDVNVVCSFLSRKCVFASQLCLLPTVQ